MFKMPLRQLNRDFYRLMWGEDLYKGGKYW